MFSLFSCISRSQWFTHVFINLTLRPVPPLSTTFFPSQLLDDAVIRIRESEGPRTRRLCHSNTDRAKLLSRGQIVFSRCH